MSLNTIEPIASLLFTVGSVDTLLLTDDIENPKRAVTSALTYMGTAELTLANQNYEFVQTEALTEAGIAVQPYGAFLMNEVAPSGPTATNIRLDLMIGETLYICTTTLSNLFTVGGPPLQFSPLS